MVVTKCLQLGAFYTASADPTGTISHRRRAQLRRTDIVAVTRTNATPGRPESAQVRHEYMALRAGVAVVVVVGSERYSRYISLRH